jgi:hypothetical protein
LAVSTDNGGSAQPARDAGVRHYEDCSLMLSPIKAEAASPPLDETRMHRLETIDRAEYVRLTGGSPDRSQAWAATVGAVRTALSRASSLVGLSVPPIIRHFATALDCSEPVTDEQWGELEVARISTTLDSASQRPGSALADTEASPYARAYHNLARAAELLMFWRGYLPEYAEIAYTAGQIMTESELWPTD